MGITRILIVGLAALILAPMPPEVETAAVNGQPVAELQTHQLVSVATGTFTDVSSFCERQPLTCRAMSDVASVAQAKVRYAIRLAYEWANDARTDGSTAPLSLQDAIPVSGDHVDNNGIAEPGAAGLQSIPDILNSSYWSDPLVTGTIRQFAEADTGTNILSIDDLVPDWRDPEPNRQG